ncbi:B-cell linker protein isoform X2 [Numida meleagris]|uniref:B-cell linker protein isoform X2 n=1 Tax=Numida meleagris TaxID=8996 RepID=UPI000B3DC549|nr:B-cell linker protein isoform X2 [Numida meleagris]
MCSWQKKNTECMIKSPSLDCNMATKLPSQEECESWTAFQVADLLRQFGMPESAVLVEKLGMDGSRFLNLSDYELSRFRIMHQPKLQKMVHDIKKNESGIINKFKKLKKKPPPSLPQRDYASEHADNEEDQWSDDFDSDYENPDGHSDSEMYVVPSEENPDDSYEPPPSEQEKKKIPSAFPISRGEYADNRTSHHQLPPINKPLPSTPSSALPRPNKPSKPSLPLPSPAAKPKLPPKPYSDDEDNYIVPVDNDDDNYIEPTESNTPLPAKPPVNRFMKPPTKSALPTPAKPSLTSDVQEVYEVPEEEEELSPPPVTRFTKPLPATRAQNTEHSHMYSMTRESPKLDASRNILPLPRNRIHPKTDHEANNNDENHSFNNTQESKFPTGAAPSPLPRALKKTSNAVNPAKPCLPSRDTFIVNEDKPTAAERRRGSGHEFPLPPLPSGTPKSSLQKPSILPKVPEGASRSLGTSPHSSISSISSTADQDAGVHSKSWYAAACDRKTAEDALYRSNKDGSFLIRKSSGQDSRQPYTLVVFYNRRVYNIPIRFIESTRQYALGKEKCGEERFDSVAEIVENHQHTSLVLIDSQNNTKDSTKLKYIVRVS